MVLLRSLIYWLGFVLITPVYAILSLMALPFPRVPRYRFVTGWCKIMVFFAARGVRPSLQGHRPRKHPEAARHADEQTPVRLGNHGADAVFFRRWCMC